jgi:hypothetical protein
MSFSGKEIPGMTIAKEFSMNPLRKFLKKTYIIKVAIVYAMDAAKKLVV